jgi:hypothetical protein
VTTSVHKHDDDECFSDLERDEYSSFDDDSDDDILDRSSDGESASDMDCDAADQQNEAKRESKLEAHTNSATNSSYGFVHECGKLSSCGNCDATKHRVSRSSDSQLAQAALRINLTSDATVSDLF